MDRVDELLGEAAGRIEVLTANLPARIEIASLSTISKLPFKALSYREASVWRSEELARSAHASFAKGDIVAGIVLTRALTETVAGVWYLMELVERQLSSGIEPDLDEKLMRLLLGHKGDDDLPEAINVLTFVSKVDKHISGVLETYNGMSEYAHPNWRGTAFAYSAIDRGNMVVELGRSSPRKRSHDVVGLTCLNGCLGILELAYNKLADLFPPFIEACEADLEKKGRREDEARS